MMLATMESHVPSIAPSPWEEESELSVNTQTDQSEKIKAFLSHAFYNQEMMNGGSTFETPLNTDSSVLQDDRVPLVQRQLSQVNLQLIESLEGSISLLNDIGIQTKNVQKIMQDTDTIPEPIIKLSQDVLSSIKETVNKNIFENSNSQHNEASLSQRRPSGKVTFPVKLHQLLLELEGSEDESGIATFLEDGLAFSITSISKFEQVVLKKYFPRMSSFRSFHRQLNIYDFKRLGKSVFRGQGEYVYSHPNFQKDQPEKAALMRPIRLKK